MARGLRLNAWAGLALALALAALLPWRAVERSVDWQPALAFTEPWRAWTAAWLHYSTLHLVANLAGAALVAAFGLAAGAPRRMALAWFCAWPLTQLGLLAQPALLHFGGLSGVLHAGVAVACVHLLADGTPRQRWVGAAVLAGLAAKVIGEAPWGEPLRRPEGWDIALAPASHASGLVAGLLCALLARTMQRFSARPR